MLEKMRGTHLIHCLRKAEKRINKFKISKKKKKRKDGTLKMK